MTRLLFCGDFGRLSLTHLTTTSKDGVSKERIEYGRAVSNCSKELAQKSHIKKNYKYNQIKN